MSQDTKLEEKYQPTYEQLKQRDENHNYVKMAENSIAQLANRMAQLQAEKETYQLALNEVAKEVAMRDETIKAQQAKIEELHDRNDALLHELRDLASQLEGGCHSDDPNVIEGDFTDTTPEDWTELQGKEVGKEELAERTGRIIPSGMVVATAPNESVEENPVETLDDILREEGYVHNVAVPADTPTNEVADFDRVKKRNFDEVMEKNSID